MRLIVIILLRGIAEIYIAITTEMYSNITGCSYSISHNIFICPYSLCKLSKLFRICRLQLLVLATRNTGHQEYWTPGILAAGAIYSISQPTVNGQEILGLVLLQPFLYLT